MGLDRWPPNVVTTIASDDEMFEAGRDSYFYWGRAALRAIQHVLAATEYRQIRAILDLPCGHGRVLRMLRAAFPAAHVTACDLNRSGVDFCAATFDARPVYASSSPSETFLRDRFDLVWCGSLLTHLDEERCLELLALLADALTPKSVLVFTTHGPRYETLCDVLELPAQAPATESPAAPTLRADAAYELARALLPACRRVGFLSVADAAIRVEAYTLGDSSPAVVRELRNASPAAASEAEVRTHVAEQHREVARDGACVLLSPKEAGRCWRQFFNPRR